jgi:hypothetical protein
MSQVRSLWAKDEGDVEFMIENALRHCETLEAEGTPEATREIIRCFDWLNYLRCKRRAYAISRILHSDFPIGSKNQMRQMRELDKMIASEPISGVTLLAIISLERKSTASQLEIELNQKLDQELRERAKKAALNSHKNRPAAKVKPMVLEFYEKHACNIEPNGEPQFKTKAAFIREARYKYGDEVLDDNTISKWIKESPVTVPHWKKRTKK